MPDKPIESHDRIRPIRWSDDHLQLLDQRALPQREEVVHLHNSAAVVSAIRDMVVRGAPAIGITAAYGVVLAAREAQTGADGDLGEAMEPALTALLNARPTAVNLHWAVARMRRTLAAAPAGKELDHLLREAHAILDQDIAANRAMGRLGADYVGPEAAVITHCNTGSLATGGFGTALGVIRSAYARGRIRQVFADETRPWLQGARLTAWELAADGIPVKLLVDAAAPALMRRQTIQWVIVGADRITANGDVANKIGTYGLAVAARHHGVRFMVVAPTSTIDSDTADGAAIPIESRPAEEVLSMAGQPVAAAGVQAWNPVFDVTPAELVDVLVTEAGVVERPDGAAIARLLGREAVA